jgi:hypothetical protein
MTTQPIIPYSKLSVRELVEVYNELAKPRGVDMINNHRGKTHTDMVFKVSTLRTRKLLQPVKPPKAPRNGSTYMQGHRKIPAATLVIVRELCRISHWEAKTVNGKGKRISEVEAKALGKEARSVGFTYAVILKAIKEELPKLKLSGGTLRGYATRARRSPGAYGNFTLPDYRPRDNTKGKKSYGR